MGFGFAVGKAKRTHQPAFEAGATPGWVRTWAKCVRKLFLLDIFLQPTAAVAPAALMLGIGHREFPYRRPPCFSFGRNDVSLELCHDDPVGGGEPLHQPLSYVAIHRD